MSDLIARLKDYCTDWDGSPLSDDTTPMDGLHCVTLREAATELEALRRRVEELEGAEKDKARLDFLDECNQRLNAHYGTTYRWELILNHNVNRLMIGGLKVDLNDAAANGAPSCREAIDKAIGSRAAAIRALSSGGAGE